MQDLLSRYRDFIRQQVLFQQDQGLLLAISGGLDSSVLLHLSVAAGFRMELAHANFGLRGEESDRDEAFVRGLAGQYGLILHTRTFDTSGYALDQKLSTQEAARELRYQWFRELLRERGLQRIITAHHADDNVETSMMNLFKGTGIAGIRGMLPLQQGVARPLLFATRAELERYAKDKGINFVEDSSNATDKYTRNHFRHQLIPLIEQWYPGAMDNLRANMARFRDVESLYREAMDRKLRKLLKPAGEEWQVPVEALRRAKPRATVIYEMFSPYGFTAGQIQEVEKLLDSETGRFITSASHRLLRNRNWLILGKLEAEARSVYTINEGQRELVFPGGKLHLTPYDPSSGFSTDSHVATLDAGDLQYPLVLRRWKQGDYFYPLGMEKKKKIARFLIDLKLSAPQKEKTWVLESGNRIIWVLGLRVDHRFRIRPSTHTALRISIV